MIRKPIQTAYWTIAILLLPLSAFSGCSDAEEAFCPKGAFIESDDFRCACSAMTSHPSPVGRVWEARYTCATSSGPAVPFGAYLLEVVDQSAHDEGREGVTKISVGRKCIVSLLYMGIGDRQTYAKETPRMLELLAQRARGLSICR